MQKSVESILRTCAVSCVWPTWYFTGDCRYGSVWSVRSGGNVIYLGGTVYLLRPSDYLLSDQFDQADTTLLCLYAGCRGADRNTGGNLNPSFSLVPCRSLYFKVWALHFKE